MITDKQLEHRLDIFLSTGTVSADVDAMVRNVIERFAVRWKIILTEKNGSRLVTHLAMALARCEKGEMVEGMEKDAMDEFRACESFLHAVEISADVISNVSITLPEGEREYLEANICLILEN